MWPYYIFRDFHVIKRLKLEIFPGKNIFPCESSFQAPISSHLNMVLRLFNCKSFKSDFFAMLDIVQSCLCSSVSLSLST